MVLVWFWGMLSRDVARQYCYECEVNDVRDVDFGLDTCVVLSAR